MGIIRIDHMVMTVRDIDATVAFYEGILGFTHHVTTEGRHALSFGEQKLNLHRAGQEFEPKATAPTPGSVDVCLITTDQIEKVTEHLIASGVEIIEGPVPRAGAIGTMTSIYFRDPDGNLVEVARYDGTP
jgi:catechol 2,3-dioxygenase-like lactoylglutathione lyase family enzyme